MPRSRNRNIHLIEESDDNYVVTPLGEGMLLGVCGEKHISAKGVVKTIDGYMVRIIVDEITRSHLQDENCTTRRATISGVWIFPIKVIHELNPRLVKKE